jgi:ankyrin repeat protein
MAYIRNVVDFDIHQAGRPLLKSEAILIQRACITSLYMLSRYILMVGASLSPEACHYLEKGALMEDQFNLEPELKALLHRFQMLPSAQISSIKISTARSSDWVRQSVRLKPQFSFLLEDLQGGMPDIANLSIGGPSGSDAKTGARNLPGRIFSYFQPDDYCCERGFWTALFNPVHAQLIENLSQNLDNDGAIRETLSETHHQQGMDLKSISLTDLSDTLLHYAAGTGHMVLLVHLVEVIGFPVDTINRLGETALLQASMRGMAAAVRYLLSKGASVSINRVDGYLPVHFVLSFPLEFQREMLDKLTNKSRNLLFAIQTIDLPGQKFSLNFNGPRSVIQSAVALSNLTFLGAVKDLSYEILDPPERELLWGQALGQASSMHLLEVMKFCFEIYPCNGVLSQLLKQALATDVFDRIVWHGPRYHHALAATVHFILSCDENITNSVDCLFYHTAVMNGNLDVLPYLLELNGSMAARGLEMAEDLLPQEPIIPRLVAGGNLGLVAEVLDLLRRAIETLSEDTLGNLTPMLLQSPIPSAIKFETIDKLLERGWKPSVLDFTRMFAILESVMRNYSFSDQESNQLLRAERVRIASRAIQLYRHNLDFLVQIFDTMQIIPKAFSGFKLFLEASKDARVDLDEVFDAFTARERQTLYHKLALSTRRALVSNDRWIGEMTEHVGQYFHRADQLNYLTEEGSSALQLGVMSSNVPFLSAFVGIFSFDDVPPPRKATITCCWEWLEYSEFEYWRTQFNEYQRSYVPDRDSDSVPVRLHHDFDIQRNFSDYRSISRTLEDLRRLSLGYQKCDDQSVWPVRSEDLRTQDFITALACVRMTDALEYQLCGKYIWELPSVEPSMAGLAEHFDYMQDVLSLMDTIFGKYRGVMDYYSSILARDFEKEQLLISEKFSLQGVVTLLYVLGGINVQVGSSGFYDVEEAKIVLGTLHCLFLEDLLQSRRSLVRYPRCSLNFNRKIDFLTQLVGQYQLLEIAKSPKDLDPASKAEPEWDGEDVDQEFAWLDELHATWEDVKKDDHWRQTTLERFTVDLTKLNSALLKMGRVEIFNASRTFEDELIQARGWVEKIRLIHRVRCFEWFQARCEPDRYDDDAKKLREERFKISRVANEILMSLQAEEGVLRSFLYNIAGYVTWRVSFSSNSVNGTFKD